MTPVRSQRISPYLPIAILGCIWNYFYIMWNARLWERRIANIMEHDLV